MSRSWYILQSYTGYEGKVERTIKTMLSKAELDSNVILDVLVPVEEIVEIKDGKKKSRKNKFLPGYVLLEMDLPEIGWKTTCSALRSIKGAGGFVGTDPNTRPRAISADEAKRILQRCGLIKGEKTAVRVRQSYNLGDVVKITDGPFGSFSGTIKEINEEKEKLSVEVQIFGRPTPVEVDFLQVERV